MRKLIAVLITLALGGFVATAQASPINSAYSVNIWNFDCGSCSISSAAEQALPTNPETSNAADYSFTYTGPIAFDATAATIGNFLNSGGGSISGLTASELSALDSTTLSTGSFGTTTLMQFTGYANRDAFGVISHDDGISLFQGGSNLVPLSASVPTTEANTNYNLGVGNFDLWYVEANGLPAVLNMTANPVPEPSGLVILGMGLVLIGFVARRHYKSS